MTIAFPEKSIKAIYKRGKNLQEILSFFSFPSTKNLIGGSISNSNNRCDICTNFMVFNNSFKCMATRKCYKIKGNLSCNSDNVIYLITCYCCTLRLIGSAITFKERFCIHQSDINPVKKRCGAAKQVSGYCTSADKFDNLKNQLIESVNVLLYFYLLLDQKL